MQYILKANDDTLVNVSQAELEHCEYAKGVYTNTNGSWLDAEEPLVIPLMNGTEITMFRAFLTLRVAHKYPPRIRDLPPIIRNSEIMEKGLIGTGYNLVHYPALIDADTMTSWDPEKTGLDQGYIHFLEALCASHTGMHEAWVIRRWLELADYVGCADLVYLLQARCAFLLLHHIKDYMIVHAANTAHTYRQKMDMYMQSSYEGANVPTDMVQFMKEYRLLKSSLSHLSLGISKRFIRHRGISIPRPEWSDAEWATFHEDAPAFYASLPVPDEDRHKLYAPKRPIELI